MVSGDAGNAPLLVRDVWKSYRAADATSVSVLERLSIEIKAGTLVSLIGPSGCGKSTLLRLIAGLEAPDSGELRLNGAPIIGPGAERGLVFQDPTLFPWLTVRGNIEAGLRARGVLKGNSALVDEFLHLMGLEAFANAYPHQLSGGMAQRTALARVLVNHPRMLLLDEPLGALDQFTRMRMQDEVLRIWQTHRATVLLVTHDVDEAIYMSDRILLMAPRPGRIEQILEVTLPRPRLRTDTTFLTLRSHILELLHLGGGTGAQDQSRGFHFSGDQ